MGNCLELIIPPYFGLLVTENLIYYEIAIAFRWETIKFESSVATSRAEGINSGVLECEKKNLDGMDMGKVVQEGLAEFIRMQ